MVELGLTGYPLGHSYSPAYFARKFKESGIEGKYSLFPIETITLFMDLIKSNPFLSGLNVTVPYKQAVIQYLDEIDESAHKIGAVNTIKIERESNKKPKLHGYNTDWIGFSESLKPLIAGHCIKKALVLGTGGSAHAVGYALKHLGIEPTYVSRIPDKSELTPAISYGDLSNDVMHSHHLIVNTTPVGMWPETSEFPAIPYELIGPGHIFYDLIYNPTETSFMKLGKQRGATVKNGLDMLHLQADAAWKIWNKT